jgi:hypothetical protein
LVTAAPPNDILLVPPELLRDLRVVTDNIYDETWSFETAKGAAYLRIWQQSDAGENKLILGPCSNGKLLGAEYLQKPEFLGGPYSVGIFVNGELHNIPEQTLILRPTIQGNFLTAMFILSPQLAMQIATARSIGAAMQPPNKDIFLGFQIDTKAGKDKLSKIILDCDQGDVTLKPRITPSTCRNQVYIDPRLVPRRPQINREDLIKVMANPWTPEWQKRRTYEDYMNQNQPVAVPYSGGTILIDPHDSCVQQYVRN